MNKENDKKDMKNNEEGSKNDIVIKIDHLQKTFGSNTVLKDVTLTLNKGENVVVLGKSGTGKSVLIKCIVRLIEADEGSIIVFGKNMAALNDNDLISVRKDIGFLFQSGALYDSMSVRENLEFPLREQKFNSNSEKEALVKEALADVGLADTIDKMPSELSGGMRKRLGLARTLILKPQIILYDEPTTGLDPVTSREISQLIVQVQQKYKASSIIITHDIACARITSNRLIVLKEGVCAAEGTFEDLEKSKEEWLHAYFIN